MSYLEEAAQKRLDARQKQADIADKEASISAVQDGAEKIVDATHPLAKTTDIDSLIEQVKEVQLAAMLGASKPSVVLTDQTDLGDKMAELGNKLTDAISKLNTSQVDAQQLKTLKDLASAVQTYNKSLGSGNDAIAKSQADLLKAVKAIDLKPVVNVPAPKVTVQSPSVDFSPLQDTIKEYFTSPDSDAKIDLACFRAQDIIDDGDLQYVGFLNPDGQWYIIENNVKENSLRYVFGNSGYQKAFKKAATYQYALLDEAISALTT